MYIVLPFKLQWFGVFLSFYFHHLKLCISKHRKHEEGAHLLWEYQLEYVFLLIFEKVPQLLAHNAPSYFLPQTLHLQMDQLINLDITN